jgi:hypothetical protein
VVIVAAPLLGRYMARVYGDGAGPGDHVFLPLERLIYRACRVDEKREQRWTVYASSLLGFSLVSFLFVYALQRVQGSLPFNPGGMSGVVARSNAPLRSEGEPDVLGRSARRASRLGSPESGCSPGRRHERTTNEPATHTPTIDSAPFDRSVTVERLRAKSDKAAAFQDKLEAGRDDNWLLATILDTFAKVAAGESLTDLDGDHRQHVPPSRCR